MKIILLILFLTGSVVHAAYRVYELQVKRADQKVQVVRTNLDPQQYKAYHHGTERVEIKLLATWWCTGDTGGFRSYCEKPNLKRQ